jgi:hypothetical protein
MAAAHDAVSERWEEITAVALALVAAPSHKLTAAEVSALTGIA